MEKYSRRFSVEEIQQILNNHMGVKTTRIHCLMSQNGMNWDGILISVYADPEPAEDTEEEDMELDDCEQCGEPAWDGYICRNCGLKNI